MAFQIRPVKGWGGVAFSGILSMLLGFMIWKQFPLSGAWAIGILHWRLFVFQWPVTCDVRISSPKK